MGTEHTIIETAKNEGLTISTDDGNIFSLEIGRWRSGMKSLGFNPGISGLMRDDLQDMIVKFINTFNSYATPEERAELLSKITGLDVKPSKT